MLRVLTCLAMTTVINFSFLTDDVSAQIRLNNRPQLSLKQKCQNGLDKIALAYFKVQPPISDSAAVLSWINSSTNAMNNFLDKNPKCKRFNNSNVNNSSSEEFRESRSRLYEHQRQIDESMNRSWKRQLCYNYGLQYHAPTNQCY